MKRQWQPGRTIYDVFNVPIYGADVRELAARQLLPRQIAEILGGDGHLIRTRFRREYHEGKLFGQARMRQELFKLAVDGNDVPALIFLAERLVYETCEYKDSEIKELFPEIWEQVTMTPIKRGRKTSTKNGGDK